MEHISGRYNIFKIRRLRRGDKFFWVISREEISEENMTSFETVTTPVMGGPNINPYDTGDYGSDTSSLGKESK